MATDIHGDDYEVLCLLAREFNEWVPPERVRSAPVAAPSDVKGDRPGDDFNRRANWADILTAHGWVADHTSGDVTYWTRPGKKVGTSATTGKCSTEGSGDLLYVFSSNAYPLEADTAYSKFAATTFLDHGGDFHAAATDMARQGYGVNAPESHIVFGPSFAAGTARGKVNPNVPPEGRIFFWISELKRLEKNDKWVWDGFISRGGITLLSALWKAGKSTLLAHLVKAFSGEETHFLGREIKATNVLYVTEEDETTWAERRDGLGIRDHMGVVCRPFKGRATMVQWKDFIVQLHDAIIKHNFGLVVIDTLSKMWPVRDENNANQTEEALLPLWALSELGTAILLVHHTRKSQGDNFTAARGSGALSAFCETLIDFDRIKGGRKDSPRRVLYSGGRYMETPRKWVIELKREEGKPERYVHDPKGADEDEEDGDEAASGSAAQKRVFTEEEHVARVYNVLGTDPYEPMSQTDIFNKLQKVGGWVQKAAQSAFMVTMCGERYATRVDGGYVRGDVVPRGALEEARKEKSSEAA